MFAFSCQDAIDGFAYFAHTTSMITQELLIYIQECTKQGYKFTAIKDMLVSYGWNEIDVMQAYVQITNKTSGKKNKQFFLMTVTPVTKYVVSIVLSVVISLAGAGAYLSLHAQTQHVINPVIAMNEESVLGESISPTLPPIASISATPSVTATPTPTATDAPVILKKSSYSIAVIGDSMVDTMGEKMEYLQNSLKNRYPNTTFTLYNYGIGAQNIEQGLARFTSAFDYKTRHYPALSTLHPDIIIVASFAYNPFSPPDSTKHAALLTQLVQEAKATGSKVYVLAEIAPLKYDFAKGPRGMQDWTDDYRAQHAQEIIDQLHNALTVAKQQGVGLIDAFEKTEVSGEFGSTQYTNTDDGIHPSEYGQLFTSNLIAKTLVFD